MHIAAAGRDDFFNQRVSPITHIPPTYLTVPMNYPLEIAAE